MEAGGGGRLYSDLYGEAPPERGTFFRLRYIKGQNFTRLIIEKGNENCF